MYQRLGYFIAQMMVSISGCPVRLKRTPLLSLWLFSISIWVSEMTAMLSVSARKQRRWRYICGPLSPAVCPIFWTALSSTEEGFFIWSSWHPLSLLAPQSHSLSAVISGSFRTASLSFTLGSIWKGFQRRGGGCYITQAWSSCPGLILTPGVKLATCCNWIDALHI